MTDDDPPLDYRAITERQRSTWSSGDFNVIALETMPISEVLCAAVDPHGGERVLDVACGSGNAALIAARRHCDVTGVDYVPELIDRARQRAAAEGTDIDFRVGDAADLPFEDGSFDVVISVLGVMFAPEQERAARELVRVCRPGGRIALASWMPAEFGGDFFAAHGRHAPPPPRAPVPTRWGTVEGLEELLGDDIESMTTERATARCYFRSIEHAVDLHRTYFGPTIQALEVVGEAGQDALLQDLAEVFQRYNRADDGTVALEMEFLQAVATRA